MYKVVSEMIQVLEKCAADYKIGDRIVMEDPKIVLNESTNVCLYALSALIPYLIPLTRELPKDDWMNQITELSCSDPHNSVKFEVTRTKTTTESNRLKLKLDSNHSTVQQSLAP